MQDFFQIVTLAADAAAAPETQRSLWQYIQEGGILAYILIAVSVLALGLIIMLAIETQLARMAPQEAILAIGRCFRDGNTNEAVRYCQAAENNCFLTRIFGGALLRCGRSQFGTLEMRTALEESGRREVERMYRQTDFVGMIAQVGPMLGLLGTVFGMIGAFSSISGQQGAARSAALAGYMSLALVNTALGLGVAIPCTIAYGILRRRVDAMSERVADIAEGLATELDARPAARSPQPAPRPAAPAPRPEPMREVRAS
jgi:biopolymer transport protein ExbB